MKLSLCVCVHFQASVHVHNLHVVCLKEEQRIRAKQAKEDLEQFLLNSDKMNSTIKYW